MGWPGRYVNVRCCEGLSMVLLQLKYPMESIDKSMDVSRFRGSISSGNDLSCLKRRKTPFLPIITTSIWII